MALTAGFAYFLFYFKLFGIFSALPLFFFVSFRKYYYDDGDEFGDTLSFWRHLVINYLMVSPCVQGLYCCGRVAL
jgi:hypothetical protein